MASTRIAAAFEIRAFENGVVWTREYTASNWFGLWWARHPFVVARDSRVLHDVWDANAERLRARAEAHERMSSLPAEEKS